MRWMLLCGTLAMAITMAAARAKTVAPPEPDDLLDVTAAKPKMKVIGDGKGHYLAFVPFGRDDLDEMLFWGDGKDFWKMRKLGAFSEGDIKFDITFWEPRVRERWQASFEFKDKKYEVTCEDRKTAFTELAAAEQKTMLEAAKFHKPRWKYQAYALARDTKGVYYFVDRQREPEGSKNFRVWSGQKGDMKAMKMKNIVSDSEGDIFVTKKGELRLVIDKQETSWNKGKKTTKLVFLPVEDNVQMIYAELGQYAGEPLGTPCDDM